MTAHPDTTRIRLAFCVDNLSLGGTELNMWRLAERLDRDRFDLVVLHGRDGPLLPRLRDQGVRTEAIRIPSFKSAATITAARELRAWLARERIDVVHAHDIYSNVLAALALSPRGPSGLIVSRRWGALHYGRALRWANRFAYARADAVLANSDGVGASLTADEGVAPERIVVVPNFGDERLFTQPDSADRAALRELLGVPADALVVGSVANLYAVKDQATLLRAVAALPPLPRAVHVVRSGEGGERGALEALARDLGLGSRVHLAGSIPDGGRYQRAFDVSALTSLSEGFPNTLVEAMAAHRPVVATRVGGVPDAVVDGETGFLVEARDHVALAHRLERMLGDEGLRARMGAAGAARAAQRFHPDVVLPLLSGIYERIVRARRG